MTRQSVTSAGAPAAIGPYSQAIAVPGAVYCSGQIGLDPASGSSSRVSRHRPTERCATSVRCSTPRA